MFNKSSNFTDVDDSTENNSLPTARMHVNMLKLSHLLLIIQTLMNVLKYPSSVDPTAPVKTLRAATNVLVKPDFNLPTVPIVQVGNSSCFT